MVKMLALVLIGIGVAGCGRPPNAAAPASRPAAPAAPAIRPVKELTLDLGWDEADLQKFITLGEAQNPRNEPGLAILYAARARIRRDRGDLAGAAADIQKSITWFEAQNPRDERSLAICYASRAGIRLVRGDLARAQADLQNVHHLVRGPEPTR